MGFAVFDISSAIQITTDLLILVRCTLRYEFERIIATAIVIGVQSTVVGLVERLLFGLINLNLRIVLTNTP